MRTKVPSEQRGAVLPRPSLSRRHARETQVWGRREPVPHRESCRLGAPPARYLSLFARPAARLCNFFASVRPTPAPPAGRFTSSARPRKASQASTGDVAHLATVRRSVPGRFSRTPGLWWMRWVEEGGGWGVGAGRRAKEGNGWGASASRFRHRKRSR
jgi:hypothetical protein